MNNQTIIVVGVVVIAAGVIIYYLYTQNNNLEQKLRSQEDTISSLRVRLENMESIFTRPPDAEIESIFEKRITNPYKEYDGNARVFTPFGKKGVEQTIEENLEKSSISNEDLDEIAEKEVAFMMNEKLS